MQAVQVGTLWRQDFVDERVVTHVVAVRRNGKSRSKVQLPIQLTYIMDSLLNHRVAAWYIVLEAFVCHTISVEILHPEKDFATRIHLPKENVKFVHQGRQVKIKVKVSEQKVACTRVVSF